MPSVDRRIEYYQISNSKGVDNGSYGNKLTELCTQLQILQREFPYNGTSVNFEILNTAQNGELTGVFTQNRTTAPTKRRKGSIKTTSVDLQSEEGICEKTYFIYDPNTSLMAVEYNYHGPKIGLMIHGINKLYKKEIDSSATRSTYVFVRGDDSVAKVSQHHRVRAVVARLHDPATMGETKESLDFPEACKQFAPPPGGQIDIKVKSKFRATPVYSMSEFLKKYLRKESDLNYYEKFNVEVEDDQTGKPIAYDLLKDKLQDKIVVMLVDGTNELDQSDIIVKMTERFQVILDCRKLPSNSGV